LLLDGPTSVVVLCLVCGVASPMVLMLPAMLLSFAFRSAVSSMMLLVSSGGLVFRGVAGPADAVLDGSEAALGGNEAVLAPV
jgi:hypothetical protein